MNAVFTETNYLNFYEYYFQAVKKVPSRVVFKDIELEKVLEQLENHKTLKLEIICTTKIYGRKKEKFKSGVSLYRVTEDIFFSVIDPPYGDLLIEILYLENQSNPKVLTLLKDVVKNCVKTKEDFKNQLHVMSGSGHFYFQKFDIKPQPINIEENYNDDFIEVDAIIKAELEKENNKGIVILHGEPGTGKTFYIRHLIATLKKQKLYIPPNLAEQIANPSFISLLEDNSNSILIIEDAESILEKRHSQSGSAVSNLLNLSDGLLADCFNIQIICTFNSPLANIDDALLRKGRLIAQYEFKALEIEKAQKLSEILGKEQIITTPLPLTEVYNLNIETGVKTKKKKMGFFNS